MSHKVKLLVAAWCPQCPVAKLFWRALRDKFGFEYEEVEIESPVGTLLADRHGIRSVPTAIVDGCVVLATQPDPDLVARLLERTA
jgi:predicted thioredoxin/glutaredoxin